MRLESATPPAILTEACPVNGEGEEKEVEVLDEGLIPALAEALESDT